MKKWTTITFWTHRSISQPLLWAEENRLKVISLFWSHWYKTQKQAVSESGAVTVAQLLLVSLSLYRCWWGGEVLACFSSSKKLKGRKEMRSGRAVEYSQLEATAVVECSPLSRTALLFTRLLPQRSREGPGLSPESVAGPRMSEFSLWGVLQYIGLGRFTEGSSSVYEAMGSRHVCWGPPDSSR